MFWLYYTCTQPGHRPTRRHRSDCLPLRTPAAPDNEMLKHKTIHMKYKVPLHRVGSFDFCIAFSTVSDNWKAQHVLQAEHHGCPWQYIFLCTTFSLYCEKKKPWPSISNTILAVFAPGPHKATPIC